MQSIIEYFDKIYIINLPYRQDRRDEIEQQLQSIGTSLSHEKINLFSAIRPEDAGEFDSIGTKGCFLSHLSILKNAKQNSYDRILILEDDVNFTKDFRNQAHQTLAFLKNNRWNIFYGGHILDLDNYNDNLVEVSPLDRIVTSHFIAIQGQAINTLFNELSLMLNRKSGDQKGGPMHVDGAYSTIRKKYPEYTTYVANPAMGYQRASRTDIHQNKWFDKIPVIKQIVSLLRKFKNLATFSTFA